MTQLDRFRALEQKLATILPITEARSRHAKGHLAFRYGVLAAALTKAREALHAVLEDEQHTCNLLR